MDIRNVTRADLDAALAAVNERYAGNIRGQFDLIRVTRDGRQTWRGVLRANDSSKAGARMAPGSERRTVAACYHAHGYFRDALPAAAVVLTSTADGVHRASPGDPWPDIEVPAGWGFTQHLAELCIGGCAGYNPRRAGTY